MRLSAISALLILLVSPSYGEDVPRFDIRPEMVEKLSMSNALGDHELGDHEYAVNIKLKAPYREEFARLTEERVGKLLEVAAFGKVFIRTVVRDNIHSGMIHVGDLKTEEEAREFMERLMPGGYVLTITMEALPEDCEEVPNGDGIYALKCRGD